MSFNLAFYFPLFSVIVLLVISYAGAKVGLEMFFGIIIPYLAFVVFFAGFINRILKWARTPVPYRIPTTCGQNKTLPWIKRTIRDQFENPDSMPYVIGRMFMEVFFFRSLFRNMRTELKAWKQYPEGGKLIYWSSKWLWIGALAFHYSFMVILLRHLRFFMEKTPAVIDLIEKLDGFFELYSPTVYASGLILVAALVYLLLRRVFDMKVRYISLASDYFPLFMILGIGLTGLLMRYFYRVDMVAVKELTLGLATFHPTIPEGIGAIFYMHLFLVSVLFAYFPFSKLMHLPGVFFSMTRNMAGSNRWKRHENPWEYDPQHFTYMDQENMYRKQMKKAGIPLEKDIEE
ncbi:MAG: sulfate reduction electron transfer complex DsrMKJOP subunit DsrM [Deltaproteobacteria bacterium]|nr:sulfate reduction electron transfer complex DsrMKJOP subunit DsrM [Deltaproteobacteria bacterium]